MKNLIENITVDQANELVGKFAKYRIGNMKNQKFYTEEELLQAIELACSNQKFSDYQKAGQFLISDNPDIEGLLNHLSNIEDTVKNEIKIEDFHKYFLRCDPETESFLNTIERMKSLIDKLTNILQGIQQEDSKIAGKFNEMSRKNLVNKKKK